jgi:hypothetical protein
MEIKAIFGLLSSLFVFLGTIPYLVDIHNKQVQPHILSWLGWAFLTGLGASAMIADGATWATAILWANAFFCLVIAIYSVIKGVGVWSTASYDYLFFLLGLIGLILWQVLDKPVIALVFAILADLFFGLPTIIKAYKEPISETRLVWLAAAISGLFGLFAINGFVFHEAAYPIYLFIYDSTMLLIVLKIIRRSPINS